ncbi:MAG: PDZ domain-containing protein, partial [Flavobacteriales bacterium]|nr:PDZ domain-containing protein [Flavobacteriales bacterium]
ACKKSTEEGCKGYVAPEGGDDKGGDDKGGDDKGGDDKDDE